MLKQSIILSSLLCSSVSYAGSFVDYAQITEVTPMFELISKPETVCQNEIIRERVEPQLNAEGIAGAIIGGAAGAVLGHQVGKGRGKDVATAIGGIAGALAGERYAGNDSSGPTYQDRSVKNCRVISNSRKELTGYNVEYVYHNQTSSVIMSEKPTSSRLPLIVNFEPK